MSQGRSTTVRDRHRASIARGKPPCAICGREIDFSLRNPDPMAYVVDHIVPLAKGGADTLDNKQAAHRRCNRDKSDKMPGESGVAVARTYVTERCWW